MEQISMKPLQASEVQEAAAVAARAFSNNPLSIAVYREHPNRERYLEASFERVFGHMQGQVFIAKKDEQVVGVLRMVEWPHCQMSMSLARH